MKPLVEKVLTSGLVDKDTVLLFERAGVLPPGSVDMVDEKALEKATKEDKAALAEELDLLASRNSLKETMLDLDQVRWPARMDISKETGVPVACGVNCVVDRMGRYYFRIQDVEKGWFLPGYRLSCEEKNVLVTKTIFESQILSVGDLPVCVQVTVS
jgi:hypothetical protein